MPATGSGNLTRRSQLLLPVEWIVEDLNRPRPPPSHHGSRNWGGPGRAGLRLPRFCSQGPKSLQDLFTH